VSRGIRGTREGNGTEKTTPLNEWDVNGIDPRDYESTITRNTKQEKKQNSVSIDTDDNATPTSSERVWLKSGNWDQVGRGPF
jgi:hypothetical protein